VDADVIVVGAGLAGLVATAELADAGKRVLVLDQEPETNLGGQAFWSFGGLFLVDSPEQRRMGIKDGHALAWQDWTGTAGFDREEDHWPRKWAQAYVDFAAGEKRAWLRAQGVRFFPVVGWAERGGYGAIGHGNSVPRFHITWGTGPGLLEPFVRRVREAEARGLVELRFRHRVDELVVEGGAVVGVRGALLEPSSAAGGRPARGSSWATSTCARRRRRHHRRHRRQPRPGAQELAGAARHAAGPDAVRGARARRRPDARDRAGRRRNSINPDRMWHYTEGVANWNPIWARPRHPDPARAVVAVARRHRQRPAGAAVPGFDTLGTLEHIGRTGHEHTWFVLTRKIVEKEFALSGSEQNPDLTGKSIRGVIDRARQDVPAPVQAFLDRGEDFVVADDLRALVEGMNRITGGTPALTYEAVERQVVARDREMKNDFTKDLQIAALRQARSYRGDKLIRVASPHELLDPAAGPLIAVRLHVITRKSLGGLETDLSGRVLRAGGEPLPGLYAAGEVAGFGGGGVHGYRSLEGTFLGGCLFSGRTAGRAAARRSPRPGRRRSGRCG
jgi:predicted oxidoreductase